MTNMYHNKSTAGRIAVRLLLATAIMCLPRLKTDAAPQKSAQWNVTALGNMKVANVTQGVVAGEDCYFLINDYSVEKITRTGAQLAKWECPKGAPLIHMNAGMLHENTLYVSHSNYPGVPMWSSVEMFDTRTLQHIGSHSFGIEYGSSTWMDYRDGYWYVCFAHYGNKAAEPARDPSWTQFVVFDSEWRRVAGYVFPPELIALCTPYSFSGGAFGPDGRIYVTGHDNPFIYVLELPNGGSVLKLVGQIPVPFHGQSFTFDPLAPWVVHGIERAKSEVVSVRIEKQPNQ